MLTRQAFRLAIAALAIAGVSQQGQAAFISGSVAFDFLGEESIPTNGNLDTATGFTFGNPGVRVSDDRTGSYTTQLTTGQLGTATPLNFTATTIGSTLITPFNIDFGGNKTFSAASGSIFVRTTGNSGSFIAALFGTVSFPGFDSTPGSLTVAFTQTGGLNQAISGSGTLFTPVDAPNAVPLPPTLILAAIGGLSMAGVRGVRRRFFAA